MKKTFILVLMVLVGIGLVFSNVKADESRTIPLKSRTVIANTVVSTQGVVIYRVSGYANASNSVYALCNSATFGAIAASNILVEGGEATQYDSLLTLDFGSEGLVFDTGLTVTLSGAYVSIVYR